MPQILEHARGRNARNICLDTAQHGWKQLVYRPMFVSATSSIYIVLCMYGFVFKSAYYQDSGE